MDIWNMKTNIYYCFFFRCIIPILFYCPDRGKFVVYSRGEGDTLVLLLHGGGYSGELL
jgi:hypothetical protein